MQFINPKTDFAFKKIFGSEQSREVLISFLDGLLYDGQNVIEDLELLNPYQAPRLRGMKDTYLDVKARLKGGEFVIIEMQVLNVEGFEKRILYNAAKTYATQLKTGEDYQLLNPVIALTITDFVMFEKVEGYRSRFVLKEKELLVDYPSDDLELVFVELPKFKQPLEELESLMEKWLFFIKNARSLDGVPDAMEQVPEIRQAFMLANQANLEPEELEDLEKREIFIHDQRNAIVKAKRQGDEEARFEIARRLLRQMDDEAIAQLTGLAVEQIQQLRL